jgi:hypothetical protein
LINQKNEKMKKYLSTAVSALLLMKLVAQPIMVESKKDLVHQYMNDITAEDLKKHLYILASDDYEGRETAERGQKMAADYIARHFYQLGLAGPVANQPNPFFQSIEFRSRQITKASISSPNFIPEFPKDFFALGYFSLPKTKSSLIFGGYGLEGDLQNIDLKNKGVVIIDGVPKDKKGNPTVETAPRLQQRIANIKNKGAEFVIVTYASPEEFDSRTQFPRAYMSKPGLTLGNEEVRFSALPTFMMHPDAVSRLMGTKPGKMNWTQTVPVQIEAQLENRKTYSENVLGYMEGTDLKDEILVVTSHYDHVGIINGEIHNGADDDGSGTVGVLEIAEAFARAKAEGNGPRRSILFMTVTGEEKGLFGSEYYADNPIFPLSSTIANLNVDMIGRTDPEREGNDPYIYIIGSDMLSTDLHRIHESVSSTFLPGLTMDYKYNSQDDPQRFYYRSDHYNFAKNNIPVIFYFNGTHEDYHQPTDTPDKIEYDLMAQRARLIFATAWELVHRDKRPIVDK